MVQNKIQQGSLWEHKDGGIYTILMVKKLYIVNKWISLVAYIPENENPEEPYVRTEKHFLESFTKKEN